MSKIYKLNFILYGNLCFTKALLDNGASVSVEKDRNMVSAIFDSSQKELYEKAKDIMVKRSQIALGA